MIVFLAFSPRIARPAKKGACAVPALPLFSEVLITMKPLLVFPDFKDRHHMNKKKTTQGENSVRGPVRSRTMLRLSKLQALMVREDVSKAAILFQLQVFFSHLTYKNIHNFSTALHEVDLRIKMDSHFRSLIFLRPPWPHFHTRSRCEGSPQHGGAAWGRGNQATRFGTAWPNLFPDSLPRSSASKKAQTARKTLGCLRLYLRGKYWNSCTAAQTFIQRLVKLT